MSVPFKKYHSKILLFGEYTVTLDSVALAMPYYGYSGFWDFSPGHTGSVIGLNNLYSHLISSDIFAELYDLPAFALDLKSDLYFASNIPSGYGLGSSGTVVAAFYDRYALDKTDDLIQLKNALAALENAFHGASSGIDPLVSYLNLPLKLNENKVFVLPELTITGYGLCLIDTGKPRQTAHLMSTFNNKLKNIAFCRGLDDLCQYNASAIQALENQNNTDLQNAFYHISKIQYDFFTEMIPETIKSVWKEGLNNGKYFFKLCGAGGGGMLLCLVADMDYAGKKLNACHKTFF